MSAPFPEPGKKIRFVLKTMAAVWMNGHCVILALLLQGPAQNKQHAHSNGWFSGGYECSGRACHDHGSFKTELY
jgi:hypothetical protein